VVAGALVTEVGAVMLALDIVTRIPLYRPDADAGFVTWLDIRVLGRDSATGEDRRVGAALAAIVHVGAIADSDESLADVLDGDGGDLQALYSLYFERDWLHRDIARTGAGSDLLYMSTFDLDRCDSRDEVAVSVVRRLCDTLASGCGLAVVPYCEGDRIAHWLAAGFEVTRAAREGAVGYLHMDTGLAPPDFIFIAPARARGGPAAPPSWTSEAQAVDECRQEFRNQHGERWIASATRERFLLTGDDISWDTVRVDHPSYEQLAAKLQLDEVPAPTFAGIILNREEQLWLTAVLLAARSFRAS